MWHLPRLGVFIAVLAVTALGAVAGAVVLVTRPTTFRPAASDTAVRDLAGLTPRQGSPANAPTVPAVGTGQARSGTESSPPAPAAPGTDGRKAALTPPRLLVVARSALPERTTEDISRLEHVRKVDSFDAGAVKVAGGDLNLLAVDPAGFRGWTPEPVAGHPGVWDALARGELVAASAAVRRLGLALGSYCQVDGGPRLRVAASASFGLPGVDGLVSTETGRRLGLLPRVALLVHGPERKTAALSAGVRELLGSGAQVITVGPGRGARAAGGETAGATGESAAKEPRTAGRPAIGRPGSYLELYRRSAGVCPGLSWTVLAAIGQVESSHGRDNGPSSAGALGPMQFMPATWKAYGVDGDGDGAADIWSPYDAVPSAAGYLCANGAGEGGARLERAVWSYNHSWSYVGKVLALARSYARAYP